MPADTVNIADLQTRLTPLADKLAGVTAQIAALTVEADAIKAEIRDLVATAGPGTYGAGTHTVSVALNRRLDIDRLAATYPATTHPQIYRLTPDAKAVRANLSPVEVDAFMVEIGEPRITVKDSK